MPTIMPPTLPTCLVFQVDDAERTLLEAWALAHPTWRLVPLNQRLTAEALLAYQQANPSHRVEALSFCTAQPIDATLLNALPHLRLVLTRSTGTNHLDVATMAQRGIVACHLQNYSSHAVAEHTLWLLLSLLKQGAQQAYYHHQAALPPYRLRRPPTLLGQEAAGLTLGLVGLGDIAQQVAALARPLGLRVLAASPTPRPSAWLAERGITQVSWPTLLAQSDLLSLHCPLTPQTHYLLNEASLAAMKPGSYLINTARGAVINPEALLAVLPPHGPLAGAALDVLINEAVLFSAPEQRPTWATTPTPSTGDATGQALRRVLDAEVALLAHPQVLFTPHTAFYTRPAVEAGVRQTLASLSAWAAGQAPPYQVALPTFIDPIS
jgi:lactate dehydrogenase-like 2-hydroxyacid dehydrogenase